MEFEQIRMEQKKKHSVIFAFSYEILIVFLQKQFFFHHTTSN